MKRKSITASELVHRLEQDPNYQARVAEPQANTDALSQVYRADEAALVALRARGIAVESVWDFVSTTDAPLDAIPIQQTPEAASSPACHLTDVAADKHFKAYGFHF